MTGRPKGSGSLYTQALADEICRRLAEGQSLRQICRDPEMPDESNVRAWARDDLNGFGPQYTRARELGYERLAEEIIEISDSSEADTYEDDDGNVRTNQEVVARARLRVDSRKWMLSKMLPKVYGEKTTTEVTGANGGPIEQSLTVSFVYPKAK